MPRSTRSKRGGLLGIALLLLPISLMSLTLASGANAQRGRRGRRPPEPVQISIAWSVFVAGLPEEAPARRPLDAEAGELPLPGSSWSCAYEAPSRVQLSSAAWSEQRGIVCRHGEARVRSRASCRVLGSEVFETPATLELGQGEEHLAVTVTLGCRGEASPVSAPESE